MDRVFGRFYGHLSFCVSIYPTRRGVPRSCRVDVLTHDTTGVPDKKRQKTRNTILERPELKPNQPGGGSARIEENVFFQNLSNIVSA